MQTKIERETCVGCGNCYAICPELYDCDEEGIAFCHIDNNEMSKKIPKELEKIAKDCLECCPTQSVIVKE